MAGHFNNSSLRGAVGHDMFYSIVAELDPANTMGWLEMVAVQRHFGQAEPGYNVDARTYSESMRLTLHWSLVYTFEDPQLLAQARASDGGLYGYFVRLHPTAFRANGACTLNPMDMARVMFNTKSSMLNPQNLRWIGVGLTQRYEAAIRAARHVRQMRSSSGQPITQDGYIRPPIPTMPEGMMIAP